MLMSVMYEVLFKVEANTVPAEVVLVTGDCSELGNWDPNKAVKLQKDSENRWSKKIKFTSLRDVVRYRYFIAQVVISDHEDHLGRCTMVSAWESHRIPRSFTINGTKTSPNKDVVDEFGQYDGNNHVCKSWLVDQSQINIRIQGNPFKIRDSKYRDQTISIKCKPVDHHYRDDHLDEEGDLPQAKNTTVKVSVLERGKSEPQVQGNYGCVFTPDCSMIFMVQSLDPEHIGFQMELFVDDNKSGDSTSGNHPPPQLLGYAFILPLDMHPSVGSRSVPLINLRHKPFGQISSIVPENTLQSFIEAANHGADMVELDVHLTKDRQAIIYHDFKVKITYKKKIGGDLELLEVPVKDLKFSELKDMKLWHKPRPDNWDEIHEEDVSTENMQPFPLLETCLKEVDIHTGFNIEIKYPQELQGGDHEQDNYHDLNNFLDTILHVMFEHHGDRRIIFSTFDCDACVALCLKQNRWPVLFLTQADTSVYPWYKNRHTQSVPMATEFCIAHGILGVNVMSEILLRDLSLIDYIKNSGLVLFTWGEDNNDSDVIAQLKEKNVEGIIYDRIDHFKTGAKESIFKMEHREKLKVLQEQFGQEDTGGSISIDLASGSGLNGF